MAYALSLNVFGGRTILAHSTRRTLGRSAAHVLQASSSFASPPHVPHRTLNYHEDGLREAFSREAEEEVVEGHMPIEMSSHLLMSYSPRVGLAASNFARLGSLPTLPDRLTQSLEVMRTVLMCS